ncbi:MAG: serine protease [Chitinophagaceae bacterium]|nr:serine protease [Chitinophagaceae bacterium]
MEDVVLLDAIERYLKGEMEPNEKAFFEDLRKNTPEVDQMVVEHHMFMQQIEAYGQNRDMKHLLHNIHADLVQVRNIKEGAVTSGGKVIQLWHKYKRVTAIAASIAGITALFISILVSYFTPMPNQGQLLYLSSQLEQIKKAQYAQSTQINDIKSKVPVDVKPNRGGTSFLIDGKGYLVTNAHIVRGSSTLLVISNKGQEFKADLAFIDESRDLAILKISDEDFKPFATLPYSIRRNTTDLGEQIFTLGFPRNEVVYNEGYLSAETGFDNDTLSYQISLNANPGNSGGPVLNKNGEVIGILSSSQKQAEGVVFAIKSRSIFNALDELKKEDTTYQHIKLPTKSAVKGMDRTRQIKEIQECVFMVKGFSK